MYWKNQMRDLLEKHGMNMKDLVQSIPGLQKKKESTDEI